MIRLQPGLLANLNTHDGLTTALQQAIALEHATIPTYLYCALLDQAGRQRGDRGAGSLNRARGNVAHVARMQHS